MKGLVMVKDRRTNNGLNTRVFICNTQEEIIEKARTLKNIVSPWVDICNYGNWYKVNLNTNEIIGARTYTIFD